MSWNDLHEEVRSRLQMVRKQSDLDSAPVILTKAEYGSIFWQLFSTQRSERFKAASINLVEQLNNYIAANRASYPPTFSIMNPLKLERPSPPARQDSIGSIQFIDRLDKLFLNNLSVKGKSEDLTDFYLGRLLYSAMRYGGLLRSDYLATFAAQLLNGKPCCYETKLWFELSGFAGETYIWQPDSLTIQLIHHWYSQQRDLPATDKLINLLRAFIQGLNLKTAGRLKLTYIINAIRARLSLEITPFALPILSGKQPNLTLKPTVFYRLISQKSPPLPLVTKNVSPPSTLPLSSGGLKYNHHFDFQRTMDCYEQIKDLLKEAKSIDKLKNSTRQQTNSAIAKQIGAKVQQADYLPPVFFYLLNWVSVRLTSQSRWSGKLAASTLISYLDTIAKPMLRSFANQHLLKMNADELAETYTLLIDEGKSLASQTKRARILRDFHIYLEEHHQATPCHLFQQYIAQSQRLEALTVDANILMPWEYSKAKSFLTDYTEQQSGLTHQQALALRVLLMLGFRCGLRRREAHFLRLQDIELLHTRDNTLSASTTIFITPHGQRALKTSSAERRIPLGFLLSDKEKTIFLEYWRARQQIGTEHSPYLFYFGAEPPLGAEGRPVAGEELLFDPLTILLQRITGDETFRFHHLRHSFATWMTWSWTSKYHRQAQPIDSLIDIPELSHLKQAKSALLHLTEGQPTRKVLHAISAIIGHAGPSMTLFYYIHSASWVIWKGLNTCTPNISRETEAVLASVDVRTATRARIGNQSDTATYNGMAAYAAKKLLAYCSPVQLKNWTEVSTFTPGALNSAVTERTLVLDIYLALLRHMNLDVPLEECAEDANIEPGRLQQAYENAQFFFNQQFNIQSDYDEKKRPRNYKRFIYQKNKRIAISPVAHLPNFPANLKSQNIALRMVKAFNLLSEPQQSEVMWAALYAVTHCSVTWPHFRFYDVECLHRFINAMHFFEKAFAVSLRMRFTLVSRAPLSSEQRTMQWQSWQLDSWVSLQRDNRVDKDYAPEGYLAVDFMAAQGSDLSRQRKRVARGKERVQSRRRPSEYGIRFGLYLLFMVVNGELPASDSSEKLVKILASPD
ncbi:hypothetical protein MN202_17035 [Rheinheimera muenzenbergensis]|uniref:Tyr recombinase domain-containing protein n=1 Tax=Rheinheimera muenzenbergensis TaxID=1193628 RepID=A0ABU8CBG2_9GAMM